MSKLSELETKVVTELATVSPNLSRYVSELKSAASGSRVLLIIAAAGGFILGALVGKFL